MNKIFFIVLLIVIMLLFFLFFVNVHDTSIDKYSNRIAQGFTVILMATNIYLTYLILSEASNERKKNNTLAITDNCWIKLLKDIQKNYNNCPKFCQSLFFDWQLKQMGWIKEHYSSNNEKWYTISLLANKIFQNWENVLTIKMLDETGLDIWLSTFIQFAHSQYLRDAWYVSRSSYTKRTKEFGDLIFDYVSKNHPKNAEELELAGQQLAQNKMFDKIVEKKINIFANIFK